MWIYRQRTGEILDPDGQVLGVGYSGHGNGLNNPDAQAQTDIGPIPQGKYSIGKAFTHPQKGPVVMQLSPYNEADTFGRSGFLIHGDSIAHAGEHAASQGCIILSRPLRAEISSSLDRTLLVVAG